MSSLNEAVKSRLQQEILKQMRAELELLESRANEAHEASTHSELRSDSKYNTQATEAGYLAGAQAKRAAELRTEIARVQQAQMAPGDSVKVGTFVRLVWTEADNLSEEWLFLLPGGGGRTVEVPPAVTIVSTLSPLGRDLIGLEGGDEGELLRSGQTRTFEVMEVR